MWGHFIWAFGNWCGSGNKIHYKLYTSVEWHARQLFRKDIREVTNHWNIFKFGKGKHIREGEAPGFLFWVRCSGLTCLKGGLVSLIWLCNQGQHSALTTNPCQGLHRCLKT